MSTKELSTAGCKVAAMAVKTSFVHLLQSPSRVTVECVNDPVFLDAFQRKVRRFRLEPELQALKKDGNDGLWMCVNDQLCFVSSDDTGLHVWRVVKDNAPPKSEST